MQQTNSLSAGALSAGALSAGALSASRRFEQVSVYLILSGLSLAIAYYFRAYLTASQVLAEDLSAHIELVRRYSAHLLSSPGIFYDRALFSGWPAFQFYGFVPHFLAAVLGQLLSLISDHPFRLAVHLLSLLNLLLLPWTLFYAANSLTRQTLNHRQQDNKATEVYLGSEFCLVLVISCLSAWFINHDEQFYGIGAGAILRVGLFSQGFGWNLLLVYLGLVFRQVESATPMKTRAMAIVLTLLVLCHTLTAVLAIFLGVLAIAWFPAVRWKLIKADIIAMFLASFWLLPFLAHAPLLATSDPYPPAGNILVLLFRYPLQLYAELANSRQEDLVKFISTIDLGHFLLLVLAVIAVLHPLVRRAQLLTAVCCAVLLAAVIFSSNYVVASLPLGVHYYRLEGLLVLVFLPPLAVVAVLLCQNSRGKVSAIRALILAMICLISFSSTVSVSNNEHQRVVSELGAGDKDKAAVVDYFRQLSQGAAAGSDAVGRIYLEHFNDYQRYPYLSAHSLASDLQRESGFEIMGGAFIESSLANRYAVVAADKLTAKTYHGYFIFSEGNNLKDQDLIEQLKQLGITHVVVGDGEFLQRLLGYTNSAVLSFGKYHVVQLGRAEIESELLNPSVASLQYPLSYVERPVVAYLDLQGNLPFSRVDYYFHARQNLASSFELLSLSSEMVAPEQVVALVINGEEKEIIKWLKHHPQHKDLLIVPFHYRGVQILSRSRRAYAPHSETERYQHLAKFFDAELKLESRLQPLSASKLDLANSNALPVKPELNWSSDGQAIALAKLSPGRLLRLNYSFHPYWIETNRTSSDPKSGSKIYRGSTERVLILPDSTEVFLRFSPWSSKVARAGAGLSAIGLMALWLLPASRVKPRVPKTVNG